LDESDGEETDYETEELDAKSKAAKHKPGKQLDSVSELGRDTTPGTGVQEIIGSAVVANHGVG
jgi:hypothetical protein